MRKVAVVTGTRAEYGLLKPLISAIGGDDKLELQLLVTGMHLMPQFGNTYQQIEEDGFQITAKIADGLKGDTAKTITKAMGTAMIGFADIFEKLRPDLMVVLGDRTEILAAVTAAIIANVPVAHIHGGETTEGVYDEYIRHAITKMSLLHFASTEGYKNRIIQLGEQPNRVFNVGAIGVDSIRQLKLLDKGSFERSIDTKLKKNTTLITFHPVTLENATAGHQFSELLKALNKLKDTTLIFTKPNSDKGGQIIIGLIDEYVSLNPEKAVSFSSLGQMRYLSALQYVTFVIGNSSSGILEVPYFRIPTINIGDRQKGRIMTESVINCEPTSEAIGKAINKSSEEAFLKRVAVQTNLYGDGRATEKILYQLKQLDITSVKKSFYDLQH